MIVNMSKKLMVVQFFTVTCLVLLICLIGVKQKDFTFDKLSKELISACKKYMADNNIETSISNSFVVYIDELIEKEYIKDSEDLDKYCISEVVYFNGILYDDYEIIENCKKNEE